MLRLPMITHLLIDVSRQTLLACRGNVVCKTYSVSTAARGVGEQLGSYCTPRGLHQVRAKIGAHAPLYSVFVKRRVTGEIYTPELGKQFPNRDWILTRILWLSGLERGKNRLGSCDTMKRYIYIHGTHDESSIGQPNSHGCIRMRNHDIVELFDAMRHGALVTIDE